MRVEVNWKGHEVLLLDSAPPLSGPDDDAGGVVANGAGSFGRPGSFAVWVGGQSFSRDGARELAARLARWAETGSLKLEGE